MTLLRQVVVFNPGTAEQLPFDIFYNLYFKDQYNLRLGLGVLASKTETEIEGQRDPRITTAQNLNYRIGLSYNFAKFNRVTLNAFADFLSKNQKLETTTTTTLQVFPNPKTTQTIESSEKLSGAGAQVGVGVKVNVYRQLSLYIEVPVSFMSETSTTYDLLRESGMPDLVEKSSSTTNGIKIVLPTTVYLVLRF